MQLWDHMPATHTRTEALQTSLIATHCPNLYKKVKKSISVANASLKEKRFEVYHLTERWILVNISCSHRLCKKQ